MRSPVKYGRSNQNKPKKRIDTQIVLMICLCDDLLKGLHHIEDRQSQLNDGEVMAAAIVVMLY